MDHSYAAKLGQLCVKPLSETELEFLRKWRNDASIAKYFRKIPYISTEQQQKWFFQYLRLSDCLYWVILSGKKAIGALSIYNIRGKKADIGRFMIGAPSARGKGYGYSAMLMVMKIGFSLIGLENIDINVHEKNIAALRIYKRLGFVTTGTHAFDAVGVELEMTISKDKFKEVNPMNKDVIMYLENGGVLPNG